MSSSPHPRKVPSRTYSLVPPKRARLLRLLGSVDLIVGVPLLLIAAPTLLVVAVEVLRGSTGNDRIGTLGVLIVITAAAIPVVWAGSMMAFRGVHVSRRAIRTSTTAWFIRIPRQRISVIDIETSHFRDLHRAVAVVVLVDGHTIELLPLSAAARDPNHPMLDQQRQAVHHLRNTLAVHGSDDAAPRPTPSPGVPKPIRLLPHERLVWQLLKSRYGRYDNVAADEIEAAHGRRGRMLLVLAATNSTLASFLAIALVAAAILLGAGSLLSWLVPTFLLFAVGAMRLAQSTRSRPDSTAAEADAPPPLR